MTARFSWHHRNARGHRPRLQSISASCEAGKQVRRLPSASERNRSTAPLWTGMPTPGPVRDSRAACLLFRSSFTGSSRIAAPQPRQSAALLGRRVGRLDEADRFSTFNRVPSKLITRSYSANIAESGGGFMSSARSTCRLRSP